MCYLKESFQVNKTSIFIFLHRLHLICNVVWEEAVWYSDIWDGRFSPEAFRWWFCSSSLLLQCHENTACSDKCVDPLQPVSNIPRCRLPGIGLHLNTLVATSVDDKVVKHETLVPGGQPISVSGSAAYILDSALVMCSSDRDICPIGDGTLMAEDAAQGSGYMVTESLNHSSPKKKR